MSENVEALPAGTFHRKRVVITGPRSLHPADFEVVYRTALKVMKDDPISVILGGAMGVDTKFFTAVTKLMAIRKLPEHFELVVVLPGFLGQAPQEFQRALEASHLPINEGPLPMRVTLVELGMDVAHPASYHARNAVMLGRAGWSAHNAVLLAFPPIGKATAGTFSTMEEARRQRMTVIEQSVRVLQS